MLFRSVQFSNSVNLLQLSYRYSDSLLFSYRENGKAHNRHRKSPRVINKKSKKVKITRNSQRPTPSTLSITDYIGLTESCAYVLVVGRVIRHAVDSRRSGCSQ